jgi:uroporphyrin-III C-methyltransferase
MTGFVTFVSAGPGDPDLLTVKAVKALQTADAVLFDDLSSGPILALAKPGTDLVGVGKRAGRASPKQDHVSRLLVDYALTGARVVRLKSGDSGIFGRLEEELLAVRAAGIPCEIVPGVTSASAAAAAAGIPLTRRIHAQRVQFITAADTSGNLPPGLNMAALADPGATTVVFMGKRTFPALAAAVVAEGLSPDTPALLAEAVSTPDQRLYRSTIAGLAEMLSRDRSDLPGLIVYGALAEADVDESP